VTKGFQKKYFNNLNATRFLAFLPVFLTHCFYTNDVNVKASSVYLFVQEHLKLGLLALDYFFVLSSFLISWIIYEEQEKLGKFSIRNFYIRRSLRIFPLYFLVVMLGYVLCFGDAFFDFHWLAPLPSFHHFLFFTLNFYMMNYGLDFLFFLTFFWSVSVEEQFYVFWALVLKFFQRLDVLISVVLILSSLVFRYVNIHDNSRLIFHTLSSLANFGIGNLLCIAFFKHANKSRSIINAIDVSLKRFIYLLFVMVCIYYNQIFCSDYMVVMERFIFAMFFAFVIADLAFSDKPSFNLERFRWMDYFGQLSFGLYCYHGIIMTMAYFLLSKFDCLRNPWLVFGLTPILLFASTLMMAHFSYRWIEKPMMKLKSKFY
jgi:peptidoglycan/LPS O-acetylase OafA/YrhL